MNKKDYLAIAKILIEGKTLFDKYPPDAILCIDQFEWMLVHLIRYFKEENPFFDEEKFYTEFSKMK